MVRGVRGATTVENNDAQEITIETKHLIDKMIEMNAIEAEHVAQVIISVTNDIDAVFPAKAMRQLEGWQYVPVMCTREIPVPGSLPKCIRVMMTVNTTKSQRDIHHIYLKNAISLRPDLSLTNKDEI